MEWKISQAGSGEWTVYATETEPSGNVRATGPHFRFLCRDDAYRKLAELTHPFVVEPNTFRAGHCSETIYQIIDTRSGAVVDSARTPNYANRIAAALNAGQPRPERPEHEYWAGRS